MAIRHRDIPCNEFLCLPEANPSHYEDDAPAPKPDRKWVEAIMPDLWPLILGRLRAMADPQARSLAAGAVAQKGLDELSLLALTDWLRENQFDGIAEEVARLPLTGGTLLVMRSPYALSPEQAARAAAGIQKLAGGARVIVLPPGWNAAAAQWLLPEEGG
jgi:hypothetical protein